MNDTLKYRKWAAADPKGALVLVHGMGAGTERWESLARFFKDRGISSYAISLKGFDGTEGEEGYVDSFETYRSDISDLFGIARMEVPSGSIFLLGESMGALIAFDIASSRAGSFDGYILISPAFASKLKFGAGRYFLILLSMLFFPRKQFRMPFNAEMCTSDKEEIEKIEKDPAEHRYATGSLLWEIFKRQVSSPVSAKRIKDPVLFLISMSDDIADPVKSAKIFDMVKTPYKDIKKYPGMKHGLSVEIGRENVFADIYAWAFGDKGAG